MAKIGYTGAFVEEIGYLSISVFTTPPGHHLIVFVYCVSIFVPFYVLCVQDSSLFVCSMRATHSDFALDMSRNGRTRDPRSPFIYRAVSRHDLSHRLLASRTSS